MPGRWLRRILFVGCILLAAGGAAVQQAPTVDQPIAISPSTIVFTLAGIVAAWMTLGKFAERQIDARLLAVDSPFVRHATDPMAHEAMRKQFATEYDSQFKLLHDLVDSYRREDGERLKQMRTEVIGPLIELNSGHRQVASDTLKYMADSIASLADAMKLVQPTIKLTS